MKMAKRTIDETKKKMLRLKFVERRPHPAHIFFYTNFEVLLASYVWYVCIYIDGSGHQKKHITVLVFSSKKVGIEGENGKVWKVRLTVSCFDVVT